MEGFILYSRFTTHRIRAFPLEDSKLFQLYVRQRANLFFIPQSRGDAKYETQVEKQAPASNEIETKSKTTQRWGTFLAQGTSLFVLDSETSGVTWHDTLHNVRHMYTDTNPRSLPFQWIKAKLERLIPIMIHFRWIACSFPVSVIYFIQFIIFHKIRYFFVHLRNTPGFFDWLNWNKLQFLRRTWSSERSYEQNFQKINYN